MLPGPAPPPPPPRPGIPSLRPLPRFPPNTLQYSAPNTGTYPVPLSRPPGMPMMMPPVHPPLPPMSVTSGQQPMMMNRPPSMSPPMSGNPPGMLVPPLPGSQFNPLSMPRPFAPLPVHPHAMHMAPPPYFPQGIPQPPLSEDAPPPLPKEPEPKKQKLDNSIPEDQFVAQHPGPATINVSVPNVDEGNLKGQLLEITVHSLSEIVGSLKEKIAGEIQLPANKQKLTGKASVLKDNLLLAYYNVGPGEPLTLSLRERGGRTR